MFDFICITWLTLAVMNANWELQNEKFLPTVGFEPGTFYLRSERAKRWAIRADKYRLPKGDRVYLILRGIWQILEMNILPLKVLTINKMPSTSKKIDIMVLTLPTLDKTCKS